MGASSGSRASTEPASSLGASGFDPARWTGKLLIRCMGRCDHQPGECTADPEYQRYLAWKREGTIPPRQMQMQWHTAAGEVLFYYPSNMNATDAADLRALIDVAFTGIDRRASAIEARSGETGTGSTEGESATAEGGDAQTQSGPSS